MKPFPAAKDPRWSSPTGPDGRIGPALNKVAVIAISTLNRRMINLRYSTS